ncbi:MAG: hypothetical protein E6R03_15105 [Hyphomicrobiaceae bacterium]|nr:MAG: hypothetical protein E6R03_15105 [Hyphomicrobiaceae bacterium]
MSLKTISNQYPKVRLAIGSHSKNYYTALNGWRALGYEPPCLLVSYAYYHSGFGKKRDGYEYADWSLDSGAFTAFNAGKPIDLDEYIEFCHKQIAEDRFLEEVFALDVIGDWEASARNTEKMWKAGIKAIPVFHPGEPWEALIEMAQSYPKIAFGCGSFRGKQRAQWVEQVFARVWPKRIHGLAIGDETTIMNFPFHSCDASTWIFRAQGFGSWHLYGNIPLRGTNNLASQVEYYLKLQQRARVKWKKQMELINSLPA